MAKISLEINDAQLKRFEKACRAYKTPPTMAAFALWAVEVGLRRFEERAGFEYGNRVNARRDAERVWP